MSLINDVLKDLDNRHSNDQAMRRVNGRRPPPLQPVETSRWPVKAVAAGSVLGGFILVMLGFWSGLFETTQANVPERNGNTISMPELAVKQPVAEVPQITQPQQVSDAMHAAKVSAVRVSKVSRGEKLELVLSRAVAHRLEERNDTRLTLSLPDTLLQTHLPDMASSDLIDAIDIQQNDTDLVMQLSLAGNGGSQTYLINETGATTLVIELFSAVVVDRDSDTANSTASIVEDQSVADSGEKPAPQPQAAFSKTTRQFSPEELDQRASDDAVELARRGQARTAVRDLKVFVQTAQTHRQASGTLATLLLSQGKLQQAQQVLVNARITYAEDVNLQKLLARILLEQGFNAQALAVLDETQMAVMDVEHLALRASLQQRTGAHAAAVASYDQLLSQHGAMASWLVGRAISLEALGRGEDARATYQQALRISEIDATLKNYANERLRVLN